MKEYHNTDPTFDEYKYAYGEPDQSKVKTMVIMKCRKGFFSSFNIRAETLPTQAI